MPSKRPQLITGEFYHIFNRGVEKRRIFLQNSDLFRFIFCLYELNDKKLIKMRDRIEERKERKKYTGETRVSTSIDINKKEPLVEVIGFCLMSNHYHLILRQLVDGGISLFMKKLANSYTGYFNEKYNRKGMGALFQGCFKAVHIKDDNQLVNLIGYVFTNPVELIESKWKEIGVKDPGKVMKFLKSYRWSSFLDYIGIPNFQSVTKRDFITELFGSQDKIRGFVESWVFSKTNFKKGFQEIEEIILE